MVKLHRERLGGLNDLLPEEESAFVNSILLLSESTHRVLFRSGNSLQLPAQVVDMKRPMDSPHEPSPCLHRS